MKNIAFKRAKEFNSLHPEYITEYIDVVYLSEADLVNYEVLPEDKFNEALSRQDALHEEFLRDNAVKQAQQAQIDSNNKRIKAKADRKDEKEYETYLNWKRMNGDK
jgi:hypothetical protein